MNPLTRLRPALAGGLCLLAAAGCDHIASPRDQWYRAVRAGTLAPVPFSHDLGLLGYSGWQFIGKLPLALAHADTIEFAVWVREEGPADTDPGEGPAPADILRSNWPPNPDTPRRIEVDLLILRTLEDGRPVYRYRAVVNGHELNRTLPAPDGYRHELTVAPPPPPARIQPGQPIPLGTATLTTWSREDGDRVAYTLDTRTFSWFLQLAPSQPP